MKKQTIMYLNGRQVVIADPEQVKEQMKPATAPKAKKAGKAAKDGDGEKKSNVERVKDEVFKYAVIRCPKILPYFTVRNPNYKVAAKYLGPEDVLHIAIYAYIQEYHPTLQATHAKNESKEGHVGQAKKILMGVKAGFSDFMVQKEGTPVALFMEVKVKPNGPTPDQLAFIAFQRKCGHFAELVYSLPQAVEIINQYAE